VNPIYSFIVWAVSALSLCHPRCDPGPRDVAVAQWRGHAMEPTCLCLCSKPACDSVCNTRLDSPLFKLFLRALICHKNQSRKPIANLRGEPSAPAAPKSRRGSPSNQIRNSSLQLP